jgi:hypothetical protein
MEISHVSDSSLAAVECATPPCPGSYHTCMQVTSQVTKMGEKSVSSDINEYQDK